MALHRAELVDMVLSRLIATESRLPALLTSYWSDLADRLQPLTHTLSNAPELLTEFQELGRRARRPPERNALVPAWNEELNLAAQELVQRLVQADGPADALTFAVAAIGVAEDAFRERYEQSVAEIQQGNVTSGGNGSEIDIRSLSGYLSQRFPDRPGIAATNVVNVPGGRSKQTVTFDITSDQGPTQSVVMRKDFPANFLETTVVEEFPLLVALSDLGGPVAKPLWLEEGSDAFGAPFLVSEKVAGQTKGTLFSVADASEGAGFELARALAYVHGLSLGATGLAKLIEFGESESAVRSLVGHWYSRWRRAATEPCLLLETAFAWLNANMDRTADEARLVHGDAGIHNMLIAGDHMTALLDWEFAHAGDPAEDIAYCKPFVRQFMDWERFLACYREAGGTSMTTQQIDYWCVWSAVRNAVATCLAHRAYIDQLDDDLRVAAIGMNTYPKLLRHLAATLKAAAST